MGGRLRGGGFGPDRIGAVSRGLWSMFGGRRARERWREKVRLEEGPGAGARPPVDVFARAPRRGAGGEAKAGREATSEGAGEEDAE